MEQGRFTQSYREEQDSHAEQPLVMESVNTLEKSAQEEAVCEQVIRDALDKLLEVPPEVASVQGDERCYPIPMSIYRDIILTSQTKEGFELRIQACDNLFRYLMELQERIEKLQNLCTCGHEDEVGSKPCLGELISVIRDLENVTGETLDRKQFVREERKRLRRIKSLCRAELVAESVIYH